MLWFNFAGLNLKTMNLKHIKDTILVNLGDIPRIVEFLFTLTLVLTSAIVITAIACIIGYKVALFLYGLLGIAI
jgi:hypothetical protein